MKRFSALILSMLMLAALSACSQNGNEETTTHPTTVPVTTVPPVSAGSRLETLKEAYSDYTQKDPSAHPLSQIVFAINGEYFILTENDRVYPFFEEAAVESNQVSLHGDCELYHCADLSGIMVLAMQNAWDAYAAQCAQDHEPVFDRGLYLFECDYFSGVYAIDSRGELIQNLTLSGMSYGKFGAFTIYVPENAAQVQPGTMTDGERTVMIRNIYTQFAADKALDAEDCEAIEFYIFEYLGAYYRLDGELTQVEADSAGELAADKFYNGWQVYLPAEAISNP